MCRDWRGFTVMVLLNKYLNQNHDWSSSAKVLVSVLLSYNENNVRGCHISSRRLWYELIMHMNYHLVHHILPQDKSMGLIHQCTYKYCTLWWNDAYLDNLVRQLGSRRTLSPKIKSQQDHMTVTIVSSTLDKHAAQKAARRVPCQPLPVLTANDHDACNEKKACDWQADDAQGLIICNNNNNSNTQPRMYQVEEQPDVLPYLKSSSHLESEGNRKKTVELSLGENRGWGQGQNDASTACWSRPYLWQAGAASQHKQLIFPCIWHNPTSVWKKRGSWGLPLCPPRHRVCLEGRELR